MTVSTSSNQKAATPSRAAHHCAKHIHIRNKVNKTHISLEDTTQKLTYGVLVAGQELGPYKEKKSKQKFLQFATNLHNLLQSTKYHCKNAYIFGTSEPKISSGVVPESVPVMNIVLSAKEPPSQLAITTVKKETEKVIPMSQLGMHRCPFKDLPLRLD
jgi:hypothetical protein